MIFFRIYQFLTWLFVYNHIILPTILPTISQSNITCPDNTTKCEIDCTTIPQLCHNTIIDCDESGSGKECYIHCNGFRRRLLELSPNTHQRNLLSIYNHSVHNGCYNTRMYCPTDQYCSIDCTAGCNNVTIYAQNSKWLYVKNCNQINNDSYCSNMNIYCPRDGRGDNTGSLSLSDSVTKICTIQADS
eukprot:100607_1